MHRTRLGRRGGRSIALAFAVALVVPLVATQATPAGAAPVVDAQSAALSASASCTNGDIEITYSGSGIERQVTTFSQEGGLTLHYYDVLAFAADYTGLEYILSQTATPPAPGTVVAVHTSIGSSPGTAATNGEFIVVYSCDALANDQGGNNVVLATCTGAYGTCWATADEYLRSIGQGTNDVVVPTYTG